MKIVINPQYEYLNRHIQAIPLRNYHPTQTFCNKRNLVQKVMIENQEFVIKKYKRPTLANCVVYTYFRKTKARKAYEYANKLLEAGFETATAVAYIEISKNGFFHTGYFISEYLSYSLFTDANQLSHKERKRFTEDFVAYTAKLHENDILHQDYNKGNILYYKKNERYHFALVDINRIHFGKGSIRNCMKALSQLGLQFDQFFSLLTKYTKFRNWNIKDSLLAYLLIQKAINIQAKMKRILKQVVKAVSTRYYQIRRKILGSKQDIISNEQ